MRDRFGWNMTNKVSVLLLALTTAAMAQSPAPAPGESQLRTRQLWDTTLLEKRPAASKAAPKAAISHGLVKGALVGVTVWRLRPSKSTDDTSVRSLVHEESGDQEYTPERISSRTPLLEGQRVRISAESAQAGYMYVIDRDEYMDGSKGDPYLIFPTQRTRGGDNKVVPGKVIEIPAQTDTPPFFKVTRSRADQVNETLTFLITPKPLEELQIGRNRLKLTEAQVAAWEKQWKTKSYKLEDIATEGKAYTAAEKAAARGEKLLTNQDPVPQTMYRVDCKKGEPVMLDLQLRIAK